MTSASIRIRRLAAGLLLALVATGAAPVLAQAPHFAIEGTQFLRDGKPFLIRSGEMHYPRVPREYWRDRLRKLRAMGLNTVTTYAFWNLHEPEPGRFDFSGNLDLAAFVRTAQEEGLEVILRPGPYICTELDFGGLPAWLLRTPGLRVRSYDPRFLDASARYMRRVAAEVAPLLSSRGGPILMVQIENEYGSYGRDRDYLQAIRQQIVDAGFDVPLFTSDGAGPHYFAGGPIPGITAVINFDGDVADAKASFAELAKFRSGEPRMVGEYWAGWFDHWGEQHHTRPTETTAQVVDWFLGEGISFNLYMAHGGTSFGWQAGANYSAQVPYQPDTSSYDYDAPIDEAGRLTPKFHAVRATIARHLPAGEQLPPLPADTRTATIPRFELREAVALRDALPMLSKPVAATLPRTMEELGQNYGFVLYRKQLATAATGPLNVNEVRDYATVLVDGVPQGTLDRRFGQRELKIEASAGATLDLLVENMGRINFGAKLDDERKGITRSISLAGNELRDWQMYPLPLANLSGLKFTRGAAPSGPAFWRGTFELKQPADTFLDTRGWGKGHVWINGHHLGRYWKIGPQQTLYVPGVWLRAGRNEVVVLDVEGANGARSLQGLENPVFDTLPGADRPPLQ